MTYRALLTLLLAALVPSAEAYVRSRTSGGNLLFRTDNQNIVYLMNDQTAAGMTNADGEVLITSDSDPFAALQGSLAAWDAVSSADVAFAPLATTPLVNDTDDNNHVFVFLDTPEIRAIVGGALAVTRTFFFLSGQLTDTDIIFNPNNTDPFSGDFIPYSTTLEPDIYDIQSIATHEVGHALGSNHTLVAGASMFPTAAIGTDFQSYISADDACFLTSAYPAPGSANDFGAISGTVTVDGQPATGVFVTAIDSAAGVTVGALTDLNDGTYSIPLPPGTYVLTVEALDGPVTPLDVRLPGPPFTQDIRADFAGGGQNPTQVQVIAGGEQTVDITVEAGQSPLDIDLIGSGPPDRSSISLGRGPILLTPGEPIDLVMAGPGIDGTLTDANIRVLVPGVTIRPGSVGVGPFTTSSGMPIVHATVDVTDPGRRAIGTFAVVTNPTAVLTGALVVAGAIPVIDNVVNGASFGLDGLGSAGAIFTVFGANFGSASNTSLFPATAFSGVRVTFDGVPVPLFAVVTSQLPHQINFLGPTDLPAAGMVEVRVANGSSVSDAFMLEMRSATPGMFNFRGDPSDPNSLIAIATFANTVWLVTSTSTADAYALRTDCAADQVSPLSPCGEPAAAGDVLTLWVTGLGLATATGTLDGDPLPTGEVAPADGNPLHFTTSTPQVTIGGVVAQIFFSGLGPGFAGLYQINIVVPAGVPVGDSVLMVLSMPNGLSHQLPIAIRP